MNGTTVRIDLMDRIFDLELDAVVNQYTVITGPVMTGYYAFVYLNDILDCKCIVAYVSLSPNKELRVQFQQFIQGPPRDQAMEVQPAKEEDGVLITRHSWINLNENI